MTNIKNDNKVNSIIFYRTLIGLSNRMIQYVVPLFIVFLNWDSFYYGLLFSVAGYLASGVIVGLGYITDVRKRKMTLILGLGAASVSLFLFYISTFSNLKGWIIAAFSVFGISRSLAEISLTTLLADSTPSKKEKTKFFSYMHFFWNMSGVVTPLLGGAYLTLFIKIRTHKTILNSFKSSNLEFLNFIADSTPYSSLILIIAIFLVITMFLTFSFPIPDTSKTEAKEMSKGEDWKKYENKSKKPIGFQLIAFFFCEALIGFASGVAIPFIRFHILTVFKPSDLVWSFILAASNVGIALGSLLMVPLTKKLGNEMILAIMHISVPLLALGLSLGTSLGVVSFFFVFRGSAANMSRPAWQSFFYSWLSPQYRGASTGFVSAGRRLLRALGTQSGSFIYNALNVWTFPIATLAYPIAIMIPIIVQKFLKTKETSEEEKLKFEQPIDTTRR